MIVCGPNDLCDKEPSKYFNFLEYREGRWDLIRARNTEIPYYK